MAAFLRVDVVEVLDGCQRLDVLDRIRADIAFPGRDGAFQLNLPSGDFVLKAFFNGKQVGKTLSVVAKEKGSIDLKEPLNVGEGT